MIWELELDQAIDKHGLADHVAELDSAGATIVAPDIAGITPAMVDRARGALLAHARVNTGGEWDVARGPLNEMEDDYATPGYFYMPRMLEVDPVFAEIQVNEVLNTLHRFVLGDDFRLASSNGFLKWRHERGSWGEFHGLHTDSPLVQPAGFGYVANMNWLLTDYTLDDGPICYLPGTHKSGTKPQGHVTEADLERVQGVEAPAGSLFVFHGSLWHGSLPRRADGLRLSTHSQRRIPVVTPSWDFRDVDDALIAASARPEVLGMLCWRTEKGLLQQGDGGRRIPQAIPNDR